jgi:hypothetical protein
MHSTSEPYDQYGPVGRPSPTANHGRNVTATTVIPRPWASNAGRPSFRSHTHDDYDRAGLALRQLGQEALGCWLMAVLAAAFGVEVESAGRTALEGVAELIAGLEGNSVFGLVQERV